METNVSYIEVFSAPDGWRWHAKAANHEIVAQGESHTSARDAKRAAGAVFPGTKMFEYGEEVNYMTDQENVEQQQEGQQADAPAEEAAPQEEQEEQAPQGTEENAE